jgi:hypothetical protein
MQTLADQEARINAPGLTASQRAALRNAQTYRSARQAASDSSRSLDDIYRGIDRAAVGRILTRTVGDPAATFANPIGTSGFQTQGEFAEAVFQRYQQYIDEAYAIFEPQVRAGIRVPPAGVSRNTYLGHLIDADARRRLRTWLAAEGITEGPGQVIQVNRRLADAITTRYRIPDIRIPGAQVILDGSLELKTIQSAQIRDFGLFSGGDGIIVVRPTQLGGSYGLVFPGS